MTIYVIAEHDNKTLKASTLSAVAAAQEYASHVNGDINILVFGKDCDAVVSKAASVSGVTKVCVAEDGRFEHQLPEAVAPELAALVSAGDVVMVAASTFGKNIMPRVAGLLDQAQVSDVIKIIDGKTFVRPIYAGNALETVESGCDIHLMTIRTTAFGAAELNGAASVESFFISDASNQSLSTFVSQETSKQDRPELTEARIVISGGRGLQSGENFKIIEELADILNAGIGASRAAVDAGYVPNDYQVGQTGKVVAPDLYIAVGISGAIQHVAGMKDSKVIVAINKDADAPIFQVADYGLCGDLFEAVPRLTELLRDSHGA